MPDRGENELTKETLLSDNINKVVNVNHQQNRVDPIIMIHLRQSPIPSRDRMSKIIGYYLLRENHALLHLDKVEIYLIFRNYSVDLCGIAFTTDFYNLNGYNQLHRVVIES